MNSHKFSREVCEQTDYLIRMINNAQGRLGTAVCKTLATNPVVPADIRLIFMQINAAGPAMNFGNNQNG